MTPHVDANAIVFFGSPRDYEGTCPRCKAPNSPMRMSYEYDAAGHLFEAGLLCLSCLLKGSN